MTKRTTSSRRSTRSTRSTRKPPAPLIQLTANQWRWLAGLILIALALLTAFSLLSANRGYVTEFWLNLLRHTLGWGTYAVPIILMALGVWVVSLGTEHPLTMPLARVLGLLVVFLSLLTLAHHLVDNPEQALAAGIGGGQVGYSLSQWLQHALGWVGAAVILVATLGIGMVLALDVSLSEVAADVSEVASNAAAWVKSLPLFQPRKRPQSFPLPPITGSAYTPEPLAPNSQAVPSPYTEQAAPRPPQPQPVEQGFRPPETRISTGAPMATSHWMLPPIADLLAETDEAEVSLSDIREKTHIIEETLRSLGVPVTVVEVNPGPVVTQFGLEPGYTERRDRDGKVKRVKVKVSRISALSNDLALALAAAPIRTRHLCPARASSGWRSPTARRRWSVCGGSWSRSNTAASPPGWRWDSGAMCRAWPWQTT